MATITLTQSGTTYRMGTDPDTVVIGPTLGYTKFVFGAAGQTAEGGSGPDTFVITAAIDADGPNDTQTTIDGDGGANILSLRGGGTFDLGLLDIANVQSIWADSNALTLENSCPDGASYNIVAGSGNDTFDLTNFGCTTRLVAGNGNDTVYIGSASQVVDLGSGTNTVWVTPDSICRTSIINGGSGADNTLIIACGACEDALMGRHVTGFAAVDLDFLQNGDLSTSPTDAGLLVSGTELGGDCVVLNNAAQSYIGDEATGFLFGPPCYLTNTVDVRGLADGVTLDGGADSNIGCYNTLTLLDSGTYDFGTSAGATSALVQNFGNVNVLGADTILTLNDLSGVACDNGGYTVNLYDHSGASLDDALTGGSGDNTFVLLGPNSCATTVEMTGSLDGGVGGTNVLDVCSGAWDLSGLTTLTDIADIDISGGASLTLSSLQITDLAAQPGGISFYDSPGGTLVIDVAPGQTDFNLASLDLNFHGLQVDIVANSLGDTIWGGSQGETIVGGTGGSGDNDFIHAGSGDDTIIAGTGTNTVIYTGDGNDTVVFGAYGSTATHDVVVTASVPLATGLVLFDHNPANGATVDLDGTTITFVAGSPEPGTNEVEIGGSLAATLGSLSTFLQDDTHLQSATYSISGGNTLEITAANSYTLPTDGTVSDSTTAGTDSTPIAANPTTGTVTLTTPPVVGDTVTIDEVTFTFVSSSPGTDQVRIGDLQTTFANLYAAVEGATYADSSSITFSSLGDTIYVTDTTGTGSSLSPLLKTSDSDLISVKEQDGSLASSTAATFTQGEFTFSGNPAAGEQVSIDGTEYTFVTSDPTGNEVLIGSSLYATLANFVCAAEESYGSSLSFEICGSEVIITADSAGVSGTFTLNTTDQDVVSSVSGLTLTGGVCTDILVDSGSVAEDVVYVGWHHYDVSAYSPDIVDFTKAQLLFQTGGTLTIDANAIAIVTDTQTQAFHLSGTVVQGAGGDGAPAGVLEIIASGLNEALTLNDAGLFGSTTTLAYTNSDCSPIVLVDDVSNVSLPTTITVDTDVANNVEIYVGTFVNATTGIVSTNNAALECNGSYGATGAGTFTPLAATVTVTLNGTGNQTVWVGSGVDDVNTNTMAYDPSGTGSDFFVFDVSATNAPAAVETAATAHAVESSYAALAGATYFFTTDALVGNPDACSPNQIDVLANTDFTGAVGTVTVGDPVSYEYGAIGNVNQVYIAAGVDATFDSWQLDNSITLSYNAAPSGTNNLSNIGGNGCPVVIYGEDGTAGYFDPTNHSWVPQVIAHSYLTINVVTPDTSAPPDGPALDLTNIYVVPGSYGEVDITINDTYSQANTIEIVDGSMPAFDTAEVSPLIVNSDGTDQTFLFDNCGGCGYFNPTDTFNGDGTTTLDVESYVTASVPCYDIAGVPQINLEGSVPGEANFTCATVSDISYFVIGAAGDTVDGADLTPVEGVGPLTGSTSFADTGAYGPAAAEFHSSQIDGSTVFIGGDSALIVDVNETTLNSASQEVFALSTNGQHISVNANVALYFTDQSNGSGYAVVRGEADFAANGATGYFIVGGATYGYGTEFLLGSSGVDSIYAGVGTDTGGVNAVGLNTILDGEGGTGTHTGFNGASDVQVSTDLLQGASMGLATFLFDTNDVTNPDLSCGPNVEALTCSTAGFAVTDDTISAYANTYSNLSCESITLNDTSAFSQIDVAANTDFYGATFDLHGVAACSASSLPSDPVVIFIETGVAAVFSDTQIGQFASDTVIIQDGGCGDANLVIDLNVYSGVEDLYANLQSVLPSYGFDYGTGENTGWNACSDTLTIVANSHGSVIRASDLPGADSGTLYLDGQGGKDTFVFDYTHNNAMTTGTDLTAPPLDGNDAGVVTGAIDITSYAATNAYINGGGGSPNVLDVAMTAPASGISVYDFTDATIENIQNIHFTSSDTMAVFSADQLSGTTVALTNNGEANPFNLIEVVGNSVDIDLSHLRLEWSGSQSEIIVNDAGTGTNSVIVLASGGSDEIVVNGYGDTIQAGNGPDLADFLHTNAANNFVFPASNLSPLTGSAGATLGTAADLVEGFNNAGVGYTGTAPNTISSTGIDPYGYLDLQGFSVSTTVDTTPVTAGQDLSGLTSYGVIEDSTLVSTNFTNGQTGLSERVNDGGIAAAVTAIEGMTAAQGQEFVLVMYANSKGATGEEDAAVFLVHHTGVTGHIAAGDIQVLGVIDHAVAAGSLLPANFFHLHA